MIGIQSLLSVVSLARENKYLTGVIVLIVLVAVVKLVGGGL